MRVAHEFVAADESPRSAVRSIFARILAQESQLAALTRDYEWRVPGSPLQSIKRLFGEQGRQIDAWLEDLARQARTMGITATPADDRPDFRRPSMPPEQATTAIGALLKQHRRLADDLRESLDELEERQPEADATCLLKDLREFHETCAWMLGVVLSSEPRPR